MKTRSNLRPLRALAIALLCTVCLCACGQSENTVRVATKPMSEQFILGEMLSLLIQHRTDLKVELTKGVGGGTGNIHPALVAGTFDLYPEYTGTAWQYVLKREDRPDAETMYALLRQLYEERFGLRWLGLYGFNNTFSLAARRDLAEQHQLGTFSDLAAAAPDMVFGAEYDFYERNDGFPRLRDAYGLRFKKNLDMDIGLKYQALEAKQIDVMVIFSTDGKLAHAPVTVLTDDKGIFASYYCGTVARLETLKKHPELEGVLRLMDGILTEADMIRLNSEVEIKKRSERDVAGEFLRGKGLLP